MKRTIFLLGILAVVFVMLFAFNANAAAAPTTTPVYVQPGNLSTTTWTNEYVYYVTGDVTIPVGQTLTIEEGTTVLFDHDVCLWVNGTLNATATGHGAITFSANYTDPGVGYWAGIVVNSTGVATLKNVNMSYADVSLFVNDGVVSIQDARISDTNEGISIIESGAKTNLTLSDLTIENYYTYGIHVENLDQAVAFSLADSELVSADGSSATGVLLEAYDSVNGTIKAVFAGVSIEGGYTAISVLAELDIQFSMTDSNCVGQDDVALDVDSVSGTIDMAIEGSTINGSDSANSYWLYTIEQVEYEFEVIPYDPTDVNQTSDDLDVLFADLPFTLNYAGYDVSQIRMGHDYIYFYNATYGNIGSVWPAYDDNQYFNGGSTFFGFVVYNDRAVFQWSSYDGSNDWRLNLYEVVVYANGDIQINYNEMETVDYGEIWFYAPPVGWYEFDYEIGSAFELDYSSWVFSGESLSMYGTGVYAATLLGDVVMTITDSTISNFAYGAIYATTDEGYVVFEMTGSTVDWINNDNYDAAINLYTEYGAMDVTVEDSHFDQIYDAVFDIESNIYEADDEYVDIINNTFNNCMMVAYVGTEVIMEDDNVTVAQEMTISRTFSDNTLTNSGTVYFDTEIYCTDNATLDIAVNDAYTNNTCETDLFLMDMPYYDWDYSDQSAMFESYTDYNNEDSLGDEAVSVDVAFTGNEFTNLPGFPYNHGSSINYAWVAEIDFGVDFSGEHLSSDYNADVTNNTVTLEQYSGSYWPIEVYSWYDVYEGDFDMSEMFSVNDNNITDMNNGIYGIYLYSSVDLYMNWEDLKTSTISGVYEINDNYFEGLGCGVYFDLYRWAQNVVGDIAINDAFSYNDNTLVDCGTALYLNVENDFYFQDYFPLETLYNGENSAMNVEYNLDIEVMDNVIECDDRYYDEAIYIDMSTDTWNNPDTMFTSPSMTGTTTIAVVGNQIVLFDDDNEGIYIDAQVGAWDAGAVSEMTYDVAIADNTISMDTESGYYNTYDTGIYLYLDNYAGTYEKDHIADSAVSTMIATVEISGNNVSEADYGIELDVYSEAYYAASAEFTTLDAIITDNVLTNCTDESISVYLDRYVETDFFSSPTLNDTMSVTISLNKVDGYYENADGIYFETDYDVYGYGPDAYNYDWWYMNGSTTFLVEDNDLSNLDGGIDGDAFGYDSFACNVIAESYILDNQISETYSDGINFEGDYVKIVGNIISGVEDDDGMDIDYAYGLISENEISNCAYDGIYGYDLYDMVISNNKVTGCGMYDGDYGIDLYYPYNVTVSGNTLTQNAFGMYIYEPYECQITDNTVDMNVAGGAYIYYVAYTVIENNSFDQNGGYGAYIYRGWDFVFGNNTCNNNLYDGLYVYLSDDRGYLYNNEFSYNGNDGLYVESYSYYYPYGGYWSGLIWIIDEEASVVMNEVNFDGEIEIADSGVLNIESVDYFYIGDSGVDGIPTLLVNGTLNVLNSYLYADYYFEFEIYGTVDAALSTFEDMYQVYVAEGSQATFRQCTFSNAEMETIFVDNSSPVFSMCTMVGNSEKSVVLIQGSDADPTITGGIIIGGLQGIYAKDTSLGNVFDTIFILNDNAGIYGENVTGKIHDNVFMLNGVGILLKGSNVSIEDNEIGWTQYIDALAGYAPLIEFLGHHIYALNSTMIADLMPELMSYGAYMMFSEIGSSLMQVGVFAEDSVLEMSGNTYGMLYQCVYVVGGSLSFSDKIETRSLEVPYYLGLNTSSLSITVQNVNGLYAANADVVVDGAEISVVDDAITLEGCTASISNSVLEAGDFDIYAMSGSEVTVVGTVLDKVKSEDSNTITVYCDLEITAVDHDGDAVSGRTVKVYDANGTEVASGKTDANGKFTASVVSYTVTDQGQSAAMTYTVKVDFKNGDVESDVAASEALTMVTITAEKDNTVTYIAVAIVGIAVLLIVVALVMRAKKP